MEKLKVILVSPNLWCINNGFKKDNVYDAIFEITLVGPQLSIINEKNVKIEVPMMCFESLQENRTRKLKELYG